MIITQLKEPIIIEYYAIVDCSLLFAKVLICSVFFFLSLFLGGKIFNCLGSWISLRSFPVKEVATSPLVTAPFITLVSIPGVVTFSLLQTCLNSLSYSSVCLCSQHDIAKTPTKLYEAAADCICSALYVCYDVANFEPLAHVLQQQVNQLLPLFLAVIETENSSK